MSKREPVRRVNLADFRRKKEEEGAIDVELDDGTVVRVPPTVLWPDDAIEAATASPPRIVEASRLVLGADEYDRFVASGGNAMILEAIVEDELGAGPGE